MAELQLRNRANVARARPGEAARFETGTVLIARGDRQGIRVSSFGMERCFEVRVEPSNGSLTQEVT